MESLINIGIWAAIIMVVIAALASIVLPLVNAIGHPKSLLKTGIGIVIIVALFLITWSIADNEVTAKYLNFGVNDNISKLIGGSLLLMYVLFALAIVGIIVSEINKALK